MCIKIYVTVCMYCTQYSNRYVDGNELYWLCLYKVLTTHAAIFIYYVTQSRPSKHCVFSITFLSTDDDGIRFCSESKQSSV